MKKLILIAVYMVCSNVSFSQELRELTRKIYIVDCTGTIPGKDPEKVENAKFCYTNIHFIGDIRKINEEGGGFLLIQKPLMDESTIRGKRVKEEVAKENPEVKKIFDADSIIQQRTMVFKKSTKTSDGRLYFHAEKGSDFELCFGGPITKGYITYNYVIIHYLKTDSYETVITNFKGITLGNFLSISTRFSEF